MAMCNISTAQGVTILSRSALDSLVRPELSPRGSEWLAGEPATLHLGTISDEELYRASFTLRNISSESVVITSLRSTCSCLRVKSACRTIEAGQSMTIDTEFNPEGRTSHFDVELLVYISADTLRPSLRLHVAGEVEPNDEWGFLPERMGALRLSRRSVLLDGLSAGVARSEAIPCANSGERALRLSGTSTIAGLRLCCEPEVLEAGAEGEITISYMAAEPVAEEITTLLIVDGVEDKPSRRAITVTLKQ